MAVDILIPTPLRRYVGGADRVEVQAASVDEALSSLAERHPELRRQLFDDAGRLRNFVNVFLGDANVRDLSKVEGRVSLKDGDTLTIVPAIAGGARGAPTAMRAKAVIE